MPTRNRPDSLGEAAYSILAQDVGSLELVVVDDASTDATPLVLERLTSDHRVRAVRNEQPLGACRSRNVGLQVAQGEYVAFCDDDDIWLPGAGRVLFEHLQQRPELAAVTSWHMVLHDSSGQVAAFRGPRRFDERQLHWQGLAIVFGMFRRSALSGVLNFDEEMVTGEDWDLWLRVARFAPIETLARVCYVYRRHAGQATTDLARQAAGRSAFLAKHGPSMSPACRLYHEAVIEGYKGGHSWMSKYLFDAARSSRVDATFASVVLLVSFGASRLGTRLSDPGLQARLMASMVRFDPSG